MQYLQILFQRPITECKLDYWDKPNVFAISSYNDHLFGPMMCLDIVLFGNEMIDWESERSVGLANC